MPEVPGSRKQWLRKIVFPASMLLACLSTMAWLRRIELHRFFCGHPAVYLAVSVALSVLLFARVLLTFFERRWFRRITLEWLSRAADIPSVKPPSFLREAGSLANAMVSRVLSPLFRTKCGKQLELEWRRLCDQDAVLYLLALSGGFFLGFSLGLYAAGALLGLAMGWVGWRVVRKWVQRRGERQRERFTQQIPAALEAVSSALAAGLSLQQALGYAAGDLPQPIQCVFHRLYNRLQLGIPMSQAFTMTRMEHPDPALCLVLDGIVLQRQVGGNLVQLLDESADYLRGRLELEQEVRSITAQGRLSGVIVTGLVPVSAMVLVVLNPGYLDILFETFLGQALLVAAIGMQLLGWGLIARFIRGMG